MPASSHDSSGTGSASFDGFVQARWEELLAALPELIRGFACRQTWLAIEVDAMQAAFAKTFDGFVQARWEAALGMIPDFVRGLACRQTWMATELDALRAAFAIQDSATLSRGSAGSIGAMHSPQQDMDNADAGPPKRKRLRGKQADPIVAVPDVPQMRTELPEGSFRVRCMVSSESPDPRASLDSQLRILSDHMREHPTVPGYLDTGMVPDPQVFDDKLAALLPPTQCAFRGCQWQLPWDESTFERQCETTLIDHVRSAHFQVVHPVCALLPQVFTDHVRVSAA